MLEEHDYSCLSRRNFNHTEEVRNADPDASEVQRNPVVPLTTTEKVEEDCVNSSNPDVHKCINLEHVRTMLDTSSQHQEEYMQTRLLSDSSSLVGKSAKEVDTEVGEYYFETDQLALRGNVDYLALLKAIVVLEAQRARAIQDLERLKCARDAALADPLAFVEKLRTNEDLQLPKQQKIMDLPSIAWDHYLASFNPLAMNNLKRTRRKYQVAEMSPKPVEISVSDSVQIAYSPSSRVSAETSENMLEGRSETFNQPWTAEEQARLEELLLKHGPEKIESRRWEKIAQELGTRTRHQVASRVQKHFVKLAKAGLAVPGRTPNLSSYIKKNHKHRQRRHNRIFPPPTIFAYDLPVYMCDDDNSSSNASTTGSTDGDINNDKMEFSDDESIPQELRDSDDYKEIITLTKLRREKMQNVEGLAQHLGYKCDHCQCEPITGTRWHCVDCSPEDVDFCDDCVDCFYETATHTSSHVLQPISVATQNSYVDGDYTTFLPGDYNYLDPNYMPAT